MNDHPTNFGLFPGDPTLLGWLTFAAYLVGAYFCWRAYRAGRAIPPPGQANPHRRRLAQWWLMVGTLLLLLGLNKQLDLQTLFTQLAKDRALAHGWYATRHLAQEFFVSILAASSVALMIFLMIRQRQSLHRILPALLGFALILAYVAARAALFNKLRVGHESSLWLLELVGIALVATNAWAHAAGNRK